MIKLTMNQAAELAGIDREAPAWLAQNRYQLGDELRRLGYRRVRGNKTQGQGDWLWEPPTGIAFSRAVGAGVAP